jgi:hypothetical protein
MPDGNSLPIDTHIVDAVPGKSASWQEILNTTKIIDLGNQLTTTRQSINSAPIPGELGKRVIVEQEIGDIFKKLASEILSFYPNIQTKTNREPDDIPQITFATDGKIVNWFMEGYLGDPSLRMTIKDPINVEEATNVLLKGSDFSQMFVVGLGLLDSKQNLPNGSSRQVQESLALIIRSII